MSKTSLFHASLTRTLCNGGYAQSRYRVYLKGSMLACLRFLVVVQRKSVMAKVCVQRHPSCYSISLVIHFILPFSLFS